MVKRISTVCSAILLLWTSAAGAQNLNATNIFFPAGVKLFTGAGAPEGVRVGPVGSLYLRNDGGASTGLCSKVTGTGNTGWACFSSLLSGTLLTSGRVVLAGAGGALTDDADLLFTGTSLGIGATPLSLLHLTHATNPTFRLTKSNATAQSWVFEVSSAGLLNVTDITAAADRLTLDLNGDLGLGTTAPANAIHVVDAVNPQLRLSTLETNSTRKQGAIGSTHYTTAEEPVGLAYADSNTTTTELNFGGGASIFNAATKISFWTAANNTTVTGTERMTIDTGGGVSIASLTSGRIPLAGTGGLLSDDADLTFATDTLSATNVVSSLLTTSGTSTAFKFTLNGTTQATQAASGYLLEVGGGDGTIIEAAAGQHPLLAGAAFFPTQITNGAGDTLNVATVYVGGAPTGITPSGGNYALWTDAGKNRFDGSVDIEMAVVVSGTNPTIASGFGTTPVITATHTAAFTVNVGTGGTASAGVITMPAATTGWNCPVTNRTAVAANRANQWTVQTATTTTSITVQNQTISTGAALAWTASDILAVVCIGY